MNEWKTRKLFYYGNLLILHPHFTYTTNPILLRKNQKKNDYSGQNMSGKCK